jgi:alpha-galactosidase
VIQSPAEEEHQVSHPVIRRALSLGAVLLALTVTAGSQVQPAWMEIARTPPMGWNSWNKFGCNVSEKLIREAADAMVSSGMKDAGYQYVVIDDCWQVSRDKNGTIVPDPQRFPGGMKALADYVHSKGLKFGVYSDAGARTCEGRPGSSGYEVEDARQYAGWGVDYLKYDWCSSDGVDPKIAYPTMRDALKATGRPILFSMCEWGRSQPWTWARGVAHVWRTTGDIQDRWASFTRLLDQQVGLEKYAGPGGWNDPDMLEVGNGGMTIPEYRAHFSFWCLLSSPLMAGNDIRTMTPEIRDILTNKDVIAIDQDPLQQGRCIRKDGDVEVWVKKLAGDAQAVILFNRGQADATVAVSWQELGLPFDAELKVRDLWSKQDLAPVKGTFSPRVPSHDVVMITVSR